MWDPTPYIEKLSQLAPASVREMAELEDFIIDTVLRQCERRPAFMCDVAQEISARQDGFVYDRGTGLIFFSAWADHELTAAALMVLRSLRSPPDWEVAREQPGLRHGALADLYLDDGYGFIANSPQLTHSSGKWPLNVGSEVVLSSQEKTWFRDLVVQYR